MLILICQVCVILRNVIADMQKRGEIYGEVDEYGNAIYVILEFGEENESGNVRDEAGNDSTLLIDCTGLTFLLDRINIVQNHEHHIQLWQQVSHHLWSVRGEN